MWEINLAEQTTSFLLSVLLGAILCILYDLLRAYRKIKRQTFVGVFIQDMLYFFVAALLTFLLMLVTTFGQVRGFVFVGIILGFALCRISLSVIVFKAAVFILGAIYKGIRRAKQKITACFRLIFKKADSAVKKFLIFLKNVVFSRKKLLHTNTNIVYNDHDLSNSK